jgi:hypothetical protein
MKRNIKAAMASLSAIGAKLVLRSHQMLNSKLELFWAGAVAALPPIAPVNASIKPPAPPEEATRPPNPPPLEAWVTPPLLFIIAPAPFATATPIATLANVLIKLILSLSNKYQNQSGVVLQVCWGLHALH